jgi:hypothetical protein
MGTEEMCSDVEVTGENAGVAVSVMATRVFEGFGAGGAQVLVRFASQWQKGVLDIEALWPRRRQSGSFRDCLDLL